MSVTQDNIALEMWDQIPVESNRGMNIIAHLDKVLRKLFPGFEFGFFSEADLQDRRVHEGYVALTLDAWQSVAEWNENVALRYGLSDSHGAMKQGSNFICRRPVEWGNKRRKYVIDESNRRFNQARKAKGGEIHQAMGGRFDVGSSLVESRSALPPEIYSEGDSDETEAIYTNAKKTLVQVPDLSMPGPPEKVEVEPKPKRMRGRPAGSKNKPKAKTPSS